MRSKERFPYLALAVLLAMSFSATDMLAGRNGARDKEQLEDAASFKDFTDRVQEYVKLKKTIEKSLPPMKSKEELPEMIVAHQQALARKIREARPQARQGDIFTKEGREAFRHVIRKVFQDPETATARVARRQRDSATPVRLLVNGNYPDAIAETTFPPALLHKLPILPDELAYRIVGRDLVLVDTRANLVVDLLHEALPQK